VIVNVACPACDGSGSDPDGDVCPVCLGQRHVAVNPDTDGGIPSEYRAWCDRRLPDMR
jgi:DnaJ-class molecular chaperone